MMETQKIMLAGQEFEIPVLSPKQNRIIVPAMVRLGDSDPRTRYDALLDIVFTALTRARPDLNRDEFDNMQIKTSELYAAVPVIQQQAGISQPKKAE